MSGIGPKRPEFEAEPPNQGIKRKREDEPQKPPKGKEKEVTRVASESISTHEPALKKRRIEETQAQVPPFPLEQLPKDLKAHIAKLFASKKNWDDPELQALLLANKEWHTEIKREVLRGRGDFASYLLDTVQGDITKLPQELKDVRLSIDELNLRHLPFDTIPSILEYFPNCTKLAIQADDLVLAAICKQCPNLTSLDLTYTLILTDISSLASLTMLTNLNVSDCDNIRSIEPLANLPKLASLNIAGCPIPNVEIEKFQKSHPKITIIR